MVSVILTRFYSLFKDLTLQIFLLKIVAVTLLAALLFWGKHDIILFGCDIVIYAEQNENNKYY